MRLSDYLPFHGNDEFIWLPDWMISELARSALVMQRFSLNAGHQERHGLRDATQAERRLQQAKGGVGEGAIKRAFGWPSVLEAGTYGDPDGPGFIQAKVMRGESFGLRVYPDTKDEQRVVGIIIPDNAVRSPPWRLIGWYYAGDAKEAKWQIDPGGKGPFYAVPQEELRPNDELRRILRLEGIGTHDRFIGASLDEYA